MKVYIVDYKKGETINTTFFMRDEEGFKYAKHFFKQIDEMFGIDTVELHRGVLKSDGTLVRKSLIRSCKKIKEEKKPFIYETVKDPSEQLSTYRYRDNQIFEKEEPKIDWSKIPRFDQNTLERIG